MAISAFIPVFNEEHRIKYALNSLQWCDEVIVLDKMSADKTVEIAKGFINTKVIIIENTKEYSANEFDIMLNECSNEWVIFFTASDLIDHSLAKEVKNLINHNSNEFDIIEVKYMRYILGINAKRSPWSGETFPIVFKKTIISINYNEVHSALSFNSNRRFKVVDYGAIHHLTHETVDTMMDRHLRYWRGEGQNYNELNLKKAFKDVLRGFKNVFIKKKTYLMGWDGVMLICAYLSYTMMSFVYKWENLNKAKAENLYKSMREYSLKEWESINEK